MQHTKFSFVVLLLLLLVIVPQVDAGLVSHWPLNGTLNDIGPSANVLEANGTSVVSFTSDHPENGRGFVTFDKSAWFTAQGGLINTTGNYSGYETENFSVSIWFNATEFHGGSTDYHIFDVSRPQSPQDLKGLRFNRNVCTSTTSCTLQFELLDTGGSTHILHFGSTDTTTDFVSGVWYHVAVTFDGVTDTARAYVNGVLVNSSDLGSFDLQSMTDKVAIGYRGLGPPDQPFEGSISNVHYFSNVLDADLVDNLYDCSSIINCSGTLQFNNFLFPTSDVIFLNGTVNGTPKGLEYNETHFIVQDRIGTAVTLYVFDVNKVGGVYKNVANISLDIPTILSTQAPQGVAVNGSDIYVGTQTGSLESPPNAPTIVQYDFAGTEVSSGVYFDPPTSLVNGFNALTVNESHVIGVTGNGFFAVYNRTGNVFETDSSVNNSIFSAVRSIHWAPYDKVFYMLNGSDVWNVSTDFLTYSGPTPVLDNSHEGLAIGLFDNTARLAVLEPDNGLVRLYAASFDVRSCLNPDGDLTLNFTSFVEENVSVRLPVSWQSSMAFYIDDSNVFLYNDSFSAQGDSFLLCISPASAVFNARGVVEYESSNGFLHRSYVLNDFLSNDTSHISVYNFNRTNDISELRAEARNTQSFNAFSDLYIELQREYVSEGVWRTVQMDKTGDFGQFFFNIIEKDVNYRFRFLDGNKTLLKQTNSVKLACDSYICELTFLVDPVGSSSVISSVGVSYAFDNSTNVLTVTYDDPTKSATSVRVVVEKQTFSSSVDICSELNSGYSGVVVCDTTGYTGPFKLTVSSTSSPETFQFTDTVPIAGTSLKELLGGSQQASFWVWFLSVGVIPAGAFFGPVGLLVTVGLSLTTTAFLQIYDFWQVGFVLVMVLVGVLIVVKVKRSG